MRNLSKTSAITEAAIAGQHHRKAPCQAPAGLIQLLAGVAGPSPQSCGTDSSVSPLPDTVSASRPVAFFPGRFTRETSWKRIGNARVPTTGSVAVQRYQQRSLQEAQTQHQIEVKRRRQRIALIERLRNRASGLAQAGVVDGHADQMLGAIRQSALQDRVETTCCGSQWQREWRKYSALPTAVLTAVGPENDTSQAASAGPGRPGNRALAAHRAGTCAAGERLQRQSLPAMARNSDSRLIGPPSANEKVFFSGRRGKSPRATFLVSRRNRAFRSMVTPKWVWMRSRIWETCSGARAFLSDMSKAMST